MKSPITTTLFPTMMNAPHLQMHLGQYYRCILRSICHHTGGCNSLCIPSCSILSCSRPLSVPFLFRASGKLEKGLIHCLCWGWKNLVLRNTRQNLFCALTNTQHLRVLRQDAHIHYSYYSEKSLIQEETEPWR